MLRQINGLRMDVTELDVLGEPRNGPVQQQLEKRTKILTVPQVFLNGKFIGDNAQIVALDGDDKLKDVIAAAL